MCPGIAGDSTYWLAMSFGGVHGIPVEYMSPATDGSTWPAVLVSTPIMARPDMEWLRLMPPSTLVGGVFQPVSSLYRPGTVGCAE